MKVECKFINPKELAEKAMDETLIKVKGKEKTLREWAKIVADLLDAEEQGKLLRLPVSVGDTVYTNTGTRYLRKKDSPYEVKVVFIGLNGSEEDSFINVKYSNDYVYGFKFSDLGEKWFLTQEEAEAKLEELRGDSDAD